MPGPTEGAEFGKRLGECLEEPPGLDKGSNSCKQVFQLRIEPVNIQQRIPTSDIVRKILDALSCLHHVKGRLA